MNATYADLDELSDELNEEIETLRQDVADLKRLVKTLREVNILMCKGILEHVEATAATKAEVSNHAEAIQQLIWGNHRLALNAMRQPLGFIDDSR